MPSDFDSIKALILSGNIKGKNIREDTYFDIGLQGHYENPFTNVLLYLLKRNNQLNKMNEFAKLFLKSLKNLNEKIISSFDLEMNIEQQYPTTNGKIIDLIIFNRNYVLVFENKINHEPNNPFEEYVSDITSRFKNLTPYFYILSKDQVKAPEKWTNILISNTFEQIKIGLSAGFNNKWDYFIDDFLTHHIKLNESIMTEEEMDFYAKHFSTIFDAYNNVEKFINIIIDKINFKLPNKLAKSPFKQNGDKETMIVRFYPIESKEDHVMLAFAPNNKFHINLYYHQDPKQKTDEIIKHLGSEDYIDQRDRSVCYFRRNKNLNFANIDEAVEECCKQITLMKEFYTKN